MFLLKLLQSEIVIEVFGYCGDLEGDELNYYVEEANVKSYMHDCSLIESEEEPIISLSINYIDFGKTNSKKDAASLPAKVVCVTNQSGRILLAKWEEGEKQFFLSKYFRYNSILLLQIKYLKLCLWWQSLNRNNQCCLK